MDRIRKWKLSDFMFAFRLLYFLLLPLLLLLLVLLSLLLLLLSLLLVHEAAQQAKQKTGFCGLDILVLFFVVAQLRSAEDRHLKKVQKYSKHVRCNQFKQIFKVTLKALHLN